MGADQGTEHTRVSPSMASKTRPAPVSWLPQNPPVIKSGASRTTRTGTGCCSPGYPIPPAMDVGRTSCRLLLPISGPVATLQLLVGQRGIGCCGTRARQEPPRQRQRRVRRSFRTVQGYGAGQERRTSYLLERGPILCTMLVPPSTIMSRTGRGRSSKSPRNGVHASQPVTVGTENMKRASNNPSPAVHAR